MFCRKVEIRIESFTSFNPFHVTGHFLYSLNTTKNSYFSDIFRGYIRDQWDEMSGNLKGEVSGNLRTEF